MSSGPLLLSSPSCRTDTGVSTSPPSSSPIFSHPHPSLSCLKCFHLHPHLPPFPLLSPSPPPICTLQPLPHLTQSPCRTLPCSTPLQPEQPNACLVESIKTDGDEHDVLQPDPSQPWWHWDQLCFRWCSQYPKEIPKARMVVADTRAVCTLPCLRGGCPFPECSEANGICCLNGTARPGAIPHLSLTQAPLFGNLPTVSPSLESLLHRWGYERSWTTPKSQ